MDRHRRQFAFWPSRATHSGVSHHFPNMFDVITPAQLSAPYNISLFRSLSWNS
ncbi:protein YoaL [Kosakonia calanthes]|uniref:protein YoaL n=1 Tax=Kosakonia calanthes TaxID=3139408 RepID=UPI003CC7F27A